VRRRPRLGSRQTKAVEAILILTKRAPEAIESTLLDAAGHTLAKRVRVERTVSISVRRAHNRAVLALTIPASAGVISDA
jgi:hypothetical protein